MRMNDRILAVDDHLDNLQILKELLEDEFTVRCVHSGPEALRVAPMFRPNLILLDVMMPDLDGNQTCRLLRALPQLAEAKIVMLSARSELNDRLKAYDVGAVDYIAKPFDDREVLAKVRAWMQMVHREQMNEIWQEAEQAAVATGSALVTLTAFRDTETPGHLFRIRWYAHALAEQLAVAGPYQDEIGNTFLERLQRASPLHDIGKVGMEAVMSKTGPLVDADWKLVRQHTVVGSNILMRAAESFPQSDYLSMAADIARHHHERWDGTGYPEGLSGTSIPLAARIVAVADAFDAFTLTQDATGAMSVVQAAEKITAEAGHRFDPAIVNAFRIRCDDFFQARERFADGYPFANDSGLVGAAIVDMCVHSNMDHIEHLMMEAGVGSVCEAV
jgi:putative two-component system response regulator